jgi:transcriptional regulator GlxA family with amidase domain
LAVFPNTTMRAEHTQGQAATGPATMRRAMDFVDAHADQPISAADIAAAAGIGVRAVQLAFKQHLGVTPMTYVRQVRLERAHRDLQVADAHSGGTVKTIAARWGFAKPERFAALYRKSYGVLPSSTLRG